MCPASLSLLALFLTLNVNRGLATIMIADVAFNVAFVVVVVRAASSGLTARSSGGRCRPQRVH